MRYSVIVAKQKAKVAKCLKSKSKMYWKMNIISFSVKKNETNRNNNYITYNSVDVV